jgi:hypothetical protein
MYVKLIKLANNERINGSNDLPINGILLGERIGPGGCTLVHISNHFILEIPVRAKSSKLANNARINGSNDLPINVILLGERIRPGGCTLFVRACTKELLEFGTSAGTSTGTSASTSASASTSLACLDSRTIA